MSTWYMTRRYSTQIEPIEVVRETQKQVIYLRRQFSLSGPDRFIETRTPKDGVFEKFFPTWEEAHQYLLKHFEERVISARLRLEQANGDLGNVKGLKAPTKEPA